MSGNGPEDAFKAIENAITGTKSLATFDDADVSSFRHNGGPPIDTGIEKMQRTGELSARAAREAFEEAAKRAIEQAKVNLWQAQEVLLAAEKFAARLHEDGEAMASQIEDGFRRSSKIASKFTTE